MQIYYTSVFINSGCYGKNARVGNLKDRHLLFPVLETGSPRSGCRWSASGEAPLPGFLPWWRDRTKLSGLCSWEH